MEMATEQTGEWRVQGINALSLLFPLCFLSQLPVGWTHPKSRGQRKKHCFFHLFGTREKWEGSEGSDGKGLDCISHRDLGVPFVWGLGEGPTVLPLEPPQATFISETPRVWSPTLLRRGCLWRPTSSYTGDQPFFPVWQRFLGPGSKVWEKTSAVVPPLCWPGPSYWGLLTARPAPGLHLRFCRALFRGHSAGGPGLGVLKVGCLALTLHPVGVTRSHHESEFPHLQTQGPGWDDVVSQGHL